MGIRDSIELEIQYECITRKKVKNCHESFFRVNGAFDVFRGPKSRNLVA